MVIHYLNFNWLVSITFDELSALEKNFDLFYIHIFFYNSSGSIALSALDSRQNLTIFYSRMTEDRKTEYFLFDVQARCVYS